MANRDKKNVSRNEGGLAMFYSKKPPSVRDWFRDVVIVLSDGGVLDEDLLARHKLPGYLRKWNHDNLNGWLRSPTVLEDEGMPAEFERLIRAINARDELFTPNIQVGLRILDELLEYPTKTIIDGKEVLLHNDLRFELMNIPNWEVIERDTWAKVGRMLTVWTAEMWPYFLLQTLGKGKEERVTHRAREARRIITIGR